MNKHLIMTRAKVLGYSTCAFLLLHSASYATLEQQVSKVSDLMLGKIAAIVVGGGMAIGGSYSLVSGNIMKGIAQFGIAALIGIAVALTKNQTIFNVLN